MIRYNTREEFCEGQTSIFDPKIEPFFIVKGNSGEYLVCEETKTSSDHHLSNGEDRTVVKVHSYPTTFNNELRSIVHRKSVQEGKHYNSISEYIQKFDDIMTDMRSLVDY